MASEPVRRHSPRTRGRPFRAIHPSTVPVLLLTLPGMTRAWLRLALCASVSALLTMAACTAEPDAPWNDADGYRWRELRVSGGSQGFTRMESGKTGVRFQNFVSDTALLRNRVLAQGAGVALGYVDGDGRPDIFLARTEGCSALYRNAGGWQFEDITKAAGVGACGRHSSGAALADIDGDGDLDLVLLSTHGPKSFFLNDGHHKFTDT